MNIFDQCLISFKRSLLRKTHIYEYLQAKFKFARLRGRTFCTLGSGFNQSSVLHSARVCLMSKKKTHDFELKMKISCYYVLHLPRSRLSAGPPQESQWLKRNLHEAPRHSHTDYRFSLWRRGQLSTPFKRWETGAAMQLFFRQQRLVRWCTFNLETGGWFRVQLMSSLCKMWENAAPSKSAWSGIWAETTNSSHPTHHYGQDLMERDSRKRWKAHRKGGSSRFFFTPRQILLSVPSMSSFFLIRKLRSIWEELMPLPVTSVHILWEKWIAES